MLGSMSHTIKEKENLLLRAKRVQGQVEALVRALEEERDCSDVLQIMSAARGAMNSLMAEIIEDHIREHVVDPARERSTSRSKGAEELIEVVQAYLR
jgi:FrmR/RcnR family transcriptional regulator, repressor of frmRAB operon